MARICRPRTRLIFAGLAVTFVTIAVARIAVIDAQTQSQTFTCYGGFTEEAIPPVLLTSLITVPNPVIPKDPVTGAPTLRPDLAEYVASLPAAIRLGKALFWEMQAGSDNKTACATCHVNGGQDARSRNQVHPGPNGQWDSTAFAPNSDLWDGAFPFATPIASNTDNIVGSQGVRRSLFQSIGKSGLEVTAAVADPVFTADGKNMRQVTGRNAPSTVNAVFNHRNFFDGRAQTEFNGVNPFGERDSSARVWFVGPVGPAQVDIHIQNASLASQAVGPPMSDVEMSAVGRTFPDLGKKLMLVKPLGLQQVSPSDSVLGAYADPVKGLTVSYKALIQQAFKPKWWNTTKTISINRKSYTMMEANTALFWGLSIMLYEATLVADQTPIDQYLRYRSVIGGTPDLTLLQAAADRLQADLPGITANNILNGLSLFELPPPPAAPPNGVGCMLCHVGAELTSASMRNLQHGVEPDDIAFVGAGFDQRMERMFWQIPPVPAGTDQVSLNPLSWTMTAFNTTTPAVPPADVPLAVYDAGYYNIGVRPTAEDLGTDAADPFGTSWSIVKMLQKLVPDTSYIKVPGTGLACGGVVVKNSTGFPLLSGSLRKTERAFVAGSFKVPGLRNVELVGPYFHNGGKSTLMQVVEMYDDGGDFHNPTTAPLIRPLGMSDEELTDVVAFLLALTDERVRWQRAPFDHPQLFVPDGDSVPGTERMIEFPATGASGGTALPRFLDLNPFSK